MTTKLIYLLASLLLTTQLPSLKYKAVNAGKEFERTLKDRLEGNDMWKSQGIK